MRNIATHRTITPSGCPSHAFILQWSHYNLPHFAYQWGAVLNLSYPVIFLPCFFISSLQLFLIRERKKQYGPLHLVGPGTVYSLWRSRYKARWVVINNLSRYSFCSFLLVDPWRCCNTPNAGMGVYACSPYYLIYNYSHCIVWCKNNLLDSCVRSDILKAKHEPFKLTSKFPFFTFLCSAL